MANRRRPQKSPLQQMLSGEVSHVAGQPSKPLPFSVTKPKVNVRSITSSRPSQGGSATRRVPNTWRPAYLGGDNRNLQSTIDSLRSNIQDDYTFSAFLGQLMEDRYSSYRDNLEQKFSQQRDDYQSQLNSAFDLARNKKEYALPEMPQVGDLKPEETQEALLKQMSRDLARVKDPKQQKNLARSYRYELERVQSLTNMYRDQRKSLENIQHDSKNYLEEQLTAEKWAPPVGSPAATSGDIAPEAAPDALSIAHGYGQDDKPKKKKDDGGLLYNAWTGLIPGGKELAEKTHIDGALKSIAGEGGDSLMWAFDKLSRPSYAVNNAALSYYNLDKDPVEGGDHGGLDAAKDFLLGGVSGKNLTDSFDEVKDGGWKEVISGAKSGFTGEDKTTFGQVVARNAANDNESDYRDSVYWQAPVGLAGDLVGDPLNFVGVGLIKAPISATHKLAETYQIGKQAKEIEKVVNHPPVYGPAERPLAKAEIEDMLGLNQRVYKKSDRVRNMREVNANIDYLTRRIDSSVDPASVDHSARIRATAQALQERRAAVVEELGDGVLLQTLRRDLENNVQAGNLSEDSIDDLALFAATLDARDIAPALHDPAMRHWAFEKAAQEEFNTTKTAERSITGYAKNKRLGSAPVGGAKERADDFSGEAHGNDATSDVALNAGATSGKRRQSINVKDAPEEISVGTKRTAWQNVLERRDNLNMLAAKGEIPQAEADSFASKVAEVENRIDYKSIEESLPDYITQDPRFEGLDFEDLRKKSFAIANQDKMVRGYQSASRSLVPLIENTRRNLANNPSEWLADVLARKERRKAYLDERVRLAQGNAYVRLLKEHIESKPASLNEDATATLTQELDEINSVLGARMLGDESSEVAGLMSRRKEIQSELKSLEGISTKPSKFESFNDLPDEFKKLDKKTGELRGIDIGRLKNKIQFKDESYSFGRRQIEDPKLRGIRDILQERFEVVRDDLSKKRLADLRAVRDDPKSNMAPADYNAKVKEILQDSAAKANDDAWKYLEDNYLNNTLSKAVYSDSIDLMRKPTDVEKSLIQDILARQRSEADDLVADKKLAKASGNTDEIARIDAELASLKDKHKLEQDRARQAFAESKAAKVEMTKRLREEAILRAAQLETSPFKTQLSINMLGRAFAIPGSQIMFQAAEKANGIRMIQRTRQGFADAFQSPASRLPEDMRDARNRAMNNTPEVIATKVNHLKNTMGRFHKKELDRTFKNMLWDGYAPPYGTDPAYDTIQENFQELLPFFQNKKIVGEHTLSIGDINRYLSDEYKLNGTPGKIDSPQDLMKAITQGKEGSDIYKDPYRTVWNLHIAVEQAQARQALIYTVGKNFGVKRVVRKDNPEMNGIIEKLRTEQDWRTVPELGNTHLFPPEVVPDIKRLLDMMEPRNISQLGSVIDKATGLWKTATTIYNPGYWTRNGVGEIMSSWLGGVNTAAPYNHAMKAMRFARKDGQEVEALKTQFPLLQHLPSESQKGSEVLFHRANGESITTEKLWVAYNDQGLKTGFVNTEFDRQYSKSSARLRDNELTNLGMRGHDNLRSAGEWYEDYLRMAHFADVMRKSDKPIAEAAKESADAVRKYHFDYTDFTDFEKTVMLRAFPFYKWTRKAAPLMLTMLFTKPGKMMAYPKVMNATSNMLTTDDLAEDDNGYAPNYEGIVPGWMQDLWLYKIGESPAQTAMEGGGGETESYGGLATPQMDALKSTAAPGPFAYGMLNPLFKLPIEVAEGHTLSEEDQQEGRTVKGVLSNLDTRPHTDMNVPYQGIIPKLTSQTPLTKFAASDRNAYDIAGLLGGNIEQNNDSRRKGELMSRKEKK